MQRGVFETETGTTVSSLCR